MQWKVNLSSLPLVPIWAPLSPSIDMHILLTVVHIFLMVPVGRICTNIDILYLMIVSFILVTCMFDQVGIL